MNAPLFHHGHVLPAGQPVLARITYELGAGFSNSDESTFRMVVHFGDNQRQAEIHIELSKDISFREFIDAHKHMPGLASGFVEVKSHLVGRLLLSRLFACGHWHNIIG